MNVGDGMVSEIQSLSNNLTSYTTVTAGWVREEHKGVEMLQTNAKLFKEILQFIKVHYLLMKTIFGGKLLSFRLPKQITCGKFSDSR